MRGYLLGIGALVIAAAGLLAGCGIKKNKEDNKNESKAGGYAQISQEEAREMMEREDGHIVVDVRREDEYAEGHIPGAICIPNETIGDSQPEELPDMGQIILIYCRSGNRSKQAAKKLSDMGYTNIYEFGGIIDWTGEVVTGSEPEVAEESSERDNGAPLSAVLSFSSFDGGGYEYSVTIDDPEIVTCTSRKEYGDPDHGIKTGSGYDVIFTFSGVKAGETHITVSAFSPIIPEEEYSYRVTVGEDLSVTIEQEKQNNEPVPEDPYPVLVIGYEGGEFIAGFEDNPASNALIDKLYDGPVELTLSDYGGFEKVGDLPWELPAEDSEITTEPGDVILYQGDKLTIYYGENTWSFTKIGHIEATREELLGAFGEGDVTVTLSLEWME